MSDLALCLIVAATAADFADVAAALATSGWEVLVTTAAAIPDRAPALLLLDARAGAGTVRAIRRRGGAMASVPILALGDAAWPAETDGVLRTAHEAAAAAAAWRPTDDAALDRLEATFGAGQIRGMTVQLRALLAEALAAIGTPEAAGLAHRLAGVAGTLGFAAAGAAWRAVAEGEADAEAAARRETRRAIATIDRRAIARTGPTSV